MSKNYNRHATVAQLRAVLADLNDDDCVHTNAIGNLTVIQRLPGGSDDHVGYIELTSGDDDDQPAATYRLFGGSFNELRRLVADVG